MNITQETANNLPNQLKQSVGCSKKCIEFINTFLACENAPNIQVDRANILKTAKTLNKIYFVHPKGKTNSVSEQTSKVLSLIISYCGSLDKRVNMTLLRQENEKIHIMKAYSFSRCRE